MPTRKIWAAGLLVLVLAVVLLTFVPIFGIGKSVSTGNATGTTPAAASPLLLDEAREAQWYTPAQADPPVVGRGYNGTDQIPGFQESDFIYTDGKYFLFSTASQNPAWIDVYVGDTPADLVKGPPAFTHVAPIRYPTVVKDGGTWNLWGVNPDHKWTEHWVSTSPNPTSFRYSDSPFSGPGEAAMVDFAVRKNPADGDWYGVGFETWDNSPLLLAKAPTAGGPWTKLNYTPRISNSGIFSDTTPPPWANASRPDPDLAFTPDGRAWVFFTGRSVAPEPQGAPSIAGMVQVDVSSGKAIGNPVALFDPDNRAAVPFNGVADLNLISAADEPDRIFAETGNGNYPLALLDLSDSPLPDGRTSNDLVRLDMESEIDLATNLRPTALQAPYTWDQNGLTVGAGGAVMSYLAASYLADFTFDVDFTPSRINPSTMNTVAFIGGASYNTGPAVSVQIDSTGDSPFITATIKGNDGNAVTMNSGIIAQPGKSYDVALSRAGSSATLSINGKITSGVATSEPLKGLDEWSLASLDTLTQTALFPFTGTIHSFVVTGSATGD